jgi:predicted nuclease of predicted toxin-antitoxin system
MKLLFDENLSPKLPGLLTATFPDGKHVRDVGLTGHTRDILRFDGSSESVLVLS